MHNVLYHITQQYFLHFFKNCFNKILIFLGLKQKNHTIRVREKIKRGLSINIDRNIIKEPVLNKISQPRNITRGLYKNYNNNNKLSPKVKHNQFQDEVKINIYEMEEIIPNYWSYFKNLVKKYNSKNTKKNIDFPYIYVKSKKSTKKRLK